MVRGRTTMIFRASSSVSSGISCNVSGESAHRSLTGALESIHEANRLPIGSFRYGALKQGRRNATSDSLAQA